MMDHVRGGEAAHVIEFRENTPDIMPEIQSQNTMVEQAKY
jgi:hypothetical protein